MIFSLLLFMTGLVIGAGLAFFITSKYLIPEVFKRLLYEQGLVIRDGKIVEAD